MTYSDEYENCVAQTASLWFAANYSSIRNLLTQNGYSAFDSVLYSIDHAGGLDAQIRFTQFTGENYRMIITESAGDGIYDKISEVEECPLSPPADSEDRVLLDIIQNEKSQMEFTAQVKAMAKALDTKT